MAPNIVNNVLKTRNAYIFASSKSATGIKRRFFFTYSVAGEECWQQGFKEISSHWLCEHTVLPAKSAGSRNSKKFLLIDCASIHCCWRRALAAGIQRSFFSLAVRAYIVAGEERWQQELKKVSSHWLCQHTLLLAISASNKN
jgi:hypothetical protein